MKISREKLRALIREQVELDRTAVGPFLVVIQDDYRTEAHIVKILPDDNWWFSPEGADLGDEGGETGFGLLEDRSKVTIFDMSRRKIQEFPGAPAAFITFDDSKEL